MIKDLSISEQRLTEVGAFAILIFLVVIAIVQFSPKNPTLSSQEQQVLGSSALACPADLDRDGDVDVDDYSIFGHNYVSVRLSDCKYDLAGDDCTYTEADRETFLEYYKSASCSL